MLPSIITSKVLLQHQNDELRTLYQVPVITLYPINCHRKELYWNIPHVSKHNATDRVNTEIDIQNSSSSRSGSNMEEASRDQERCRAFHKTEPTALRPSRNEWTIIDHAPGTALPYTIWSYLNVSSLVLFEIAKMAR